MEEFMYFYSPTIPHRGVVNMYGKALIPMAMEILITMPNDMFRCYFILN
jgi:hypothetical protein